MALFEFDTKMPFSDNIYHNRDCQFLWNGLQKIGSPNFTKSDLEALYSKYCKTYHWTAWIAPSCDCIDEFAIWLSKQ